MNKKTDKDATENPCRHRSRTTTMCERFGKDQPIKCRCSLECARWQLENGNRCKAVKCKENKEIFK